MKQRIALVTGGIGGLGTATAGPCTSRGGWWWPATVPAPMNGPGTGRSSNARRDTRSTSARWTSPTSIPAGPAWSGSKGQFGQVNYSAAKAGLHGFTKALAREGAGKGVLVNTISPGYIDTPMTRAVPKEIMARIIEEIPVGHIGRPEDIARTVAFLTADEADYITGANFSINGGHHMF